MNPIVPDTVICGDFTEKTRNNRLGLPCTTRRTDICRGGKSRGRGLVKQACLLCIQMERGMTKVSAGVRSR